MQLHLLPLQPKTREGGALIVNGDMKYRDQIVDAVKDRDIKVFTFGKNPGNDFEARNIHLNELGNATYELYIHGEDKGEVTLSVTGEHNAVNSLSAIAASLYIGISLEDIKEGLRNVTVPTDVSSTREQLSKA